CCATAGDEASARTTRRRRVAVMGCLSERRAHGEAAAKLDVQGLATVDAQAIVAAVGAGLAEARAGAALPGHEVRRGVAVELDVDGRVEGDAQDEPGSAAEGTRERGRVVGRLLVADEGQRLEVQLGLEAPLLDDVGGVQLEA